jgi:hypothetical protein
MAPSAMRPNPASGPDLGSEMNSEISLSVIPCLAFQSDGHFEVSIWNPPVPL